MVIMTSRTRVILFTLVIFLCSTATFSQKTKSIGVPDWVKDVVFYQIFPERFANGDPSNDPPGTEAWGGTPKPHNYFGGDLQGVIDHLDYLQRLGVTALYLNPINESSSNHKYHPKSYSKIDPHFGNDRVFQNLVDECHRRGIRIIIDGVFNHTGVDFFAFEDIKKNEARSRYLNWYNIHSFPVGPPSKPNYECWWGLGDLPKLMTDSPEVRKHLFDATKHMMRFGIDGWRLDVPNEISHDFWIEWRKLVKAQNPQAYIVGEIWQDASPWLQGDQFDAVMNYRFRDACIALFCNETVLPSKFDSMLTATRNDYPENVCFVLQNLVGSHDTERYLTLCKSDVGKVKITSLMQMTYIGAPMIYYGDEIGMEGEKDPDCRRTMIWDSTRWNMDLYQWYRQVLSLRSRLAPLRRGTYKTLLADDERSIFAFIRELEGESVVVVLNNRAVSQEITLSVPEKTPGLWEDQLSGRTYSASGKQLSNVLLPERSGAVLIPVARN